ncbi:hypothetical protein, partial [Moorena sp. SIO4G3]|uniref:hypothetical protein n=1 Tax=Moorena sp. SIO4G3 TaxID=2607821 RepID=UPI00142B87EE
MKLINNYNISCKLQLMGAIAGSVTMVLYPAIAEAESTQAAEDKLPVIDLKPSQLPSLDLKQEPILSFNPGLVPSLNQNELSTTIALRQSSSFNINDGQFPSFDLSSDQVPRLNWKREPIVSFNSTLTPSPIPQTEPSSHIALAPVVDLSKGSLSSFDLLPGQLPQLNSPKALLANLDLKQQQRVSLNPSINTEPRKTIPIDHRSRYANAPSQSSTEITIAASIDFQQGQLPEFGVNREQFPKIDLTNNKLDNLQLRTPQRVSLNKRVNREARQTIPIPETQSNQEITIAASIDFQQGDLPEFAVNRELPKIDLTNDKLDNLQLRTPQRVSLNKRVNREARQTIPIPASRSSTEITIAASIDFQQGQLPEFGVNRELPKIDLTNDKLDNLQLRTPQRVSLNPSINTEAKQTIPIPASQSDQEIAYAPGIDFQQGKLPNFEVNRELPKIDLTNDKLDNLQLRTPQRVSLNPTANTEAKQTIPIPETQSDTDIAYVPGIDIQVGDLPNFEVSGELPLLDLTNDKLDNLELGTPQRVSLNKRVNREARQTRPIPETQSDTDIAYAPDLDIQVGDLPTFAVNDELPLLDLTNDKLDNFEVRTQQRVSFNPAANTE